MWAYPPYPYLGHRDKGQGQKEEEMHALMLEGFAKDRVKELHREAAVWRLARIGKKTEIEPRTPLVRVSRLHRPSLVS
jgi:hypothetical protein